MRYIASLRTVGTRLCDFLLSVETPSGFCTLHTFGRDRYGCMLVCRMCGSALWSFGYELGREDVLGLSLYQYVTDKQCEWSHGFETRGDHPYAWQHPDCFVQHACACICAGKRSWRTLKGVASHPSVVSSSAS